MCSPCSHRRARGNETKLPRQKLKWPITHSLTENSAKHPSGRVPEGHHARRCLQRGARGHQMCTSSTSMVNAQQMEGFRPAERDHCLSGGGAPQPPGAPHRSFGPCPSAAQPLDIIMCTSLSALKTTSVQAVYATNCCRDNMSGLRHLAHVRLRKRSHDRSRLWQHKFHH